MSNIKNDLPFVEEVIIKERLDKELISKEKTTQTQLGFGDILKEKVKAPQEFIRLEKVGRNYMCSTLGWKELVCERYGFTANGKWIQLDIPQEIMAKLELDLGKEINYPLYINPEILNRETTFGGITLKNEKEIFIEKPLTREKETQTELSSSKITGWEEQVKEKANQINQLNQRVKELEDGAKKSEKIKNEELANLRKDRDKLTKEVADANNAKNSIEQQLTNTQAELVRVQTERDILERRRNAVLKYLRNYITAEQYNQFIQVNNKIN